MIAVYNLFMMVNRLVQETLYLWDNLVFAFAFTEFSVTESRGKC